MPSTGPEDSWAGHRRAFYRQYPADEVEAEAIGLTIERHGAKEVSAHLAGRPDVPCLRARVLDPGDRRFPSVTNCTLAGPVHVISAIPYDRPRITTWPASDVSPECRESTRPERPALPPQPMVAVWGPRLPGCTHRVSQSRGRLTETRRDLGVRIDRAIKVLAASPRVRCRQRRASAGAQGADRA